MEANGRPASFDVESTITEISAPNKLVYDSPFGPEMMTTSAEFTEGPDGVSMKLTIAATSEGMIGGAVMGWNSSLERFAEKLSS
jgi:hypothetical protein